MLAALLLTAALQIPLLPVPPDNVRIPEPGPGFTVRQVRRAVDLVCDVAIDANEHEGSVIFKSAELGRVMGYCLLARITLGERGLTHDLDERLDYQLKELPDAERTYLQPYLTLVKVLLQTLIG